MVRRNQHESGYGTRSKEDAAEPKALPHSIIARYSAPGVDGVTWQTHGENLEEKLEDLHNKPAGPQSGFEVTHD
jgi:hypothetical protein